MIYNNILEAIGNTPMIRLNRMPEEGSAEVLVKMEGLNVGGSIKTRTALNMIEQAEKEVERLSAEAEQLLEDLPGDHSALTELIRMLIGRRS